MAKFKIEDVDKHIEEIRAKYKQPVTPAQEPNRLPKLMAFLKSRGKVRTPQI